jgi:purine nucleoside permease
MGQWSIGSGWRRIRGSTAVIVLALLATRAIAAESGTAATAAAPLPVKVLVINLFRLEAAPWIAALKPTRDLVIPGRSSDPAQGTLGSVAWARYLVDAGIAHEIDARELPRGWSEGYFGVMTNGPNEVPKFDYRTEVFRLDEALLQQALALSRGAKLEDAADLQVYRRHYPEAAATRAPSVLQCDSLSGDTWWSGRRLGEHARHWTRLLTDGKGVYCTTQQEDNAVLNALTRGSEAKLLDLSRVADLRSGADFDRPYPGQQALATLIDQRKLADSATIAARNLVHAGMPLVSAIVAHWDLWQHGVPKRAQRAGG